MTQIDEFECHFLQKGHPLKNLMLVGEKGIRGAPLSLPGLCQKWTSVSYATNISEIIQQQNTYMY